MILVLTNCPPALRGDLTKWLIEVNSGVYVGKVSARVRDEIWKRVCEHIRSGQATLIYPTDNEQGMTFRIHNTVWEPIDYDGVTLMLRPNPSYIEQKEVLPLKAGFSDVAKFAKLKRIQKYRSDKNNVDTYCVLDIETTGFDINQDEIIEIGILKVTGNDISEFSELIRPSKPIPPSITELTGITEDMLISEGDDEKLILQDMLEFIGSFPIVLFNGRFDINFLQFRLRVNGLSPIRNRSIDILSVSRKILPVLPNYKLGTIAEFLNVDYSGAHRALCDCYITNEVYNKLKQKNEKGI